MNLDHKFREHKGGFRWEGVELHAYKEEGGAPFKDVVRQTLFRDERLQGELRYFEIAPGGHTTLERHAHAHAVVIIRGGGQCLVGDDVRDLSTLDLVSIPPMSWHQFRAGHDEPLGFLCMVDRERDRPQLPTSEDLEALRRNPTIKRFLQSSEERI